MGSIHNNGAPSLSTCLIAGGTAGVCVDMTLFPLDTLKTRLQTAQGFSAAGGLKKLYRGITPILVGSAPGAALFFLTYESLKQACSLISPNRSDSAFVHIFSASFAEVSACTVRVPIEVLKQRMQVHQYGANLLNAAQSLYRGEGLLGFYRGFQATVQREIPFACIQYPLYELLKRKWTSRLQAASQDDGQQVELKSWKAAICGSIAGGVTATLTTPLDVIKTRIILSTRDEVKAYISPWSAMVKLWREGGMRRLFSGAGPRFLWISFGGFIFFGAYEKAKRILQNSPSRRI